MTSNMNDCTTEYLAYVHAITFNFGSDDREMSEIKYYVNLKKLEFYSHLAYNSGMFTMIY